MRIKMSRYRDTRNKTFHYTLAVPMPRADVAWEFIRAMGEPDVVDTVEAEMAKQLLDELIARLVSFKRDGGQVEVFHSGGLTGKDI